MRYALYLTTPPDAPLTRAAEAWLGRSAYTGATSDPAAPTAAAAHVPARYGFHATLRAPFRLAEGVSEADLRAAFDAHAAACTPEIARLTVGRLGAFLALLAADNAPLAQTAEATLRAFEPLRAPQTAEERARRNPDRLDERGRALLDQWGYPHVMERFTFHMTLSGPLDPAAADAVAAAARAHFDPLLEAPQTLVHALFRQEAADRPFTIIASQDSRP